MTLLFSVDPRVSEWLWMGSPLPTLCLIILYLGMVYSGPKIMKNRAPFDMKALLFVFNAFIVVLNFWMLWEVKMYMYMFAILKSCNFGST